MLLSDSATITTYVVASDASTPPSQLTSSLAPYAPVDRIGEIV